MQLTKKEIDEALNERHSQEVQQKLAAGYVTIAIPFLYGFRI